MSGIILTEVAGRNRGRLLVRVDDRRLQFCHHFLKHFTWDTSDELHSPSYTRYG